jgi:ABC-type multidrug transport system fused ATPase/permease subunit
MRTSKAIYLGPSADGLGVENFAAPASSQFLFQRRLFNFLWVRLKPYRKLIVLSVGISLVTAGLAVVPPWAFKRAADHLTRFQSWLPIIYWAGAGLAATSLFSISQAFSGYWLNLIQARLSLSLRNELFECVQGLPLDFHLRRRTGELASLIGNDTEAASSGLVILFDSLLRHPLNIIGLTVLMFYFDAWLSLTALLSLPLMNFMTTIIGKKSRVAEGEFLNSQGNLLGAIIENLTNVKQVKSLGLEADRRNLIAVLGNQAIGWRQRALFYQSSIGPVAEAANLLVLSGMAVMAYYQIAKGTSSTGEVVGCLTAAFALKGSVRKLAESFLMLQRSTAAVNRLEWILGRTSTSMGQQVVLNDPVGSIELIDLSFSYDGQRPVLLKVHFKVNRGERIAVWGPSGSGKTTLMDLITGLYPPTTGQIRINGLEMNEIDLNSFRQQVGVVTQDPFLFEGTIEENIVFGHPTIDEAEIQKAAELAGLRETLGRLPQGLKTPVGERGARLSGGERKRVALARALVRPISILILDEATSEMESQVEEEILSSIDSLSTDLIIFIVSHRESILSHCDKILEVSFGRVKLKEAAALS